jgi:hypothetical protein
MSSTIPLPPREQLCNRYYSNKQHLMQLSCKTHVVIEHLAKRFCSSSSRSITICMGRPSRPGWPWGCRQKEAVSGWEYVHVLDGSGGKTHWKCKFCNKVGGSRVIGHFLGKLCAGKGARDQHLRWGRDLHARRVLVSEGSPWKVAKK